MIALSTFVLAIAMVESGNNPAKVGAAGERSEYQISRTVWHEHTTRRFSAANTQDRVFTKIVAMSHAKFLALSIESFHHTVSVEQAAVAWNAGLSYLRGHGWDVSRCDRKVRDYARRVKNTYEQLKKEGK